MTRPQRISLIVLLLLKLVVGVVEVGARPMWFGHEADYFSVVRFLAAHGRLPARSDYEGAERGADITQATQPPLFTYAALPIVALLDDESQRVPPGRQPGIVCEIPSQATYPFMFTTAYNFPPEGAPVAGYALRLMNLLLSLGMMLLVYHMTHAIIGAPHTTALVAAAFAGFQPQLFELSTVISGESLLLLFTAANLFYALRLVRGPAIRSTDLAGLIVTAILGPLTKTNGYVLIIGSIAVLVYLTLHHMFTNPRSRATRLLLISAGVLLAGVIAISIFNYVQYNSVIGRYQHLLTDSVNRLRDLNETNLVSTLRDTYYDYINNTSFPFRRSEALWLYTAGGVAGLILFGVRVAVLVARRDRERLSMDLLLLFYALAAFVLVLMRGNLVSDIAPDKTFAPVRYYLSGLPAMVVMSALGWQALASALRAGGVTNWIGGRVPRLAAPLAWNWPGLLWALVWIALVVWATADAALARPAQTYSASEFEALAAQGNLTLTSDDAAAPPPDAPHLHGYEYTAGEDGILHLTAYLSVQETSALNYAVRVALDDSAGAHATCEYIPQDGLYPVPRWEPDQIVAVEMDVPNCSVDGDGSMSGPLDVTLSWLPANVQGEFLPQSHLIEQRFSLEADLPHATRCLTNLGVFDETFQVIRYSGPETATAGEMYLPAVNWYVRETIPNSDLLRRYILTHDETGQSYTCQGVPRLDEYPIDQWRRGEIVYFDQCALTIPPDAPRGTYTLSVGLLDRASGELLPLTAPAGVASAEGLLVVTQVPVQ